MLNFGNKFVKLLILRERERERERENQIIYSPSNYLEDWISFTHY